MVNLTSCLRFIRHETNTNQNVESYKCRARAHSHVVPEHVAGGHLLVGNEFRYIMNAWKKTSSSTSCLPSCSIQCSLPVEESKKTVYLTSCLQSGQMLCYRQVPQNGPPHILLSNWSIALLPPGTTQWSTSQGCRNATTREESTRPTRGPMEPTEIKGVREVMCSAYVMMSAGRPPADSVKRARNL